MTEPKLTHAQMRGLWLLRKGGICGADIGNGPGRIPARTARHLEHHELAKYVDGEQALENTAKGMALLAVREAKEQGIELPAFAVMWRISGSRRNSKATIVLACCTCSREVRVARGGKQPCPRVRCGDCGATAVLSAFGLVQQKRGRAHEITYDELSGGG